MSKSDTVSQQLPQRFLLGYGSGTDVQIVQEEDSCEKLAEVAHTEAGWTIRDLGGRTPVHVDDRAIAGRVILDPGSIVRVGGWSWAVPRGKSVPAPRTGLRITLENVTLAVSRPLREKVNLLTSVNVDVQPGEFVGILGPSGSGKSTLLHLMNGDYLPSEGTIRFNNQFPEAFLAINSNRMAYLPQEPILHDRLTPRWALGYSSRLRGIGPRKTTAATINATLAEVGVTHRANTPIRKLSGGEKKRVALAAELLGEPSALFLDEATSGLDPGLEKEMMELFRRLADSGKTVVCITHYPDNVTMCDRLIVVAQGQVLFEGTPPELLKHFQISRIGDLYSKLSSDMNSFLNASAGPAALHLTAKQVTFDADACPAEDARTTPPDLGSQTAILAARYLHLLVLDIKSVFLLLLQAPVIAFLIGATFGNIAVDYSEQHAADWKQVAFLLIMSVIWCASTNGVREIVKERTIYLHEKRYNLSSVAYLASKFLPLGLISICQTFLLLFILGTISHFAGSWTSHSLVLSLVALASTALGLCISSGVKTSERAMTLLPVILIGQAVFSGGLARLTGLVRVLAGIFVPAFWGLNGLQATLPSNLLEATFVSSPGEYQPPILGRGASLWLDLMALSLQAIALLGLALFCLKRTSTSG